MPVFSEQQTVQQLAVRKNQQNKMPLFLAEHAVCYWELNTCAFSRKDHFQTPLLNLKYKQNSKIFLVFYKLLLVFPGLKIYIFWNYVNGDFFDLFHIGSDVINTEPVFRFVCISEKIRNCSLGHCEEHKMDKRLKQ